MRTTMDLPDPVFRRLKARAALEGLSLKDLIARYVTAGLDASADPGSGRVAEPAAASARQVAALDLMQDGCGLVRSGHRDLATDPRHLAGFGRD